MLADSLLLGQILDRAPRLNLLQHSDNLRLRVSAPRHRPSTFLSFKSYCDLDGF